ncbi:MAG: uracil-DNA glycosylase family protein [Vulcanimicrobiota bacterium]
MTPAILERLNQKLSQLKFSQPVTHVYNPLVYASKPFQLYVDRYGQGPKEAILVGMNPGPWGMAQTGVPFGEVAHVRDWLGLQAPVDQPLQVHPKRPIEGFECKRSEVSGARLWGFFADQFGTPDRFFQRFFIHNYCPLIFLEESGRNRTPDKLKAGEKKKLFAACDEALRDTVEELAPRLVIGVGGFAESRAREALAGLDVEVARILHPSPANPAANRGWAEAAGQTLAEMGLLGAT